MQPKSSRQHTAKTSRIITNKYGVPLEVRVPYIASSHDTRVSVPSNSCFHAVDWVNPVAFADLPSRHNQPSSLFDCPAELSRNISVLIRVPDTWFLIEHWTISISVVEDLRSASSYYQRMTTGVFKLSRASRQQHHHSCQRGPVRCLTNTGTMISRHNNAWEGSRRRQLCGLPPTFCAHVRRANEHHMETSSLEVIQHTAPLHKTPPATFSVCLW